MATDNPSSGNVTHQSPSRSDTYNHFEYLRMEGERSVRMSSHYRNWRLEYTQMKKDTANQLSDIQILYPTEKQHSNINEYVSWSKDETGTSKKLHTSEKFPYITQTRSDSRDYGINLQEGIISSSLLKEQALH